MSNSENTIVHYLLILQPLIPFFVHCPHDLNNYRLRLNILTYFTLTHLNINILQIISLNKRVFSKSGTALRSRTVIYWTVKPCRLPTCSWVVEMGSSLV